MENFIIVVVLLIIVGLAVAYIIKEKKKGVKCIGCPAAGNCAHKCNSASGGCSCGDEEGHCKDHTDTKE